MSLWLIRCPQGAAKGNVLTCSTNFALFPCGNEQARWAEAPSAAPLKAPRKNDFARMLRDGRTKATTPCANMGAGELLTLHHCQGVNLQTKKELTASKPPP